MVGMAWFEYDAHSRRQMMNVDDLFCLTNEELIAHTIWRPNQTIEDRLTPFTLKLFREYMEHPKFADKKVFDCRQHAAFGTAELEDGCLPTLTRNCGGFVHHTLQRPLYPQELLLSMGIPCISRFANAAGIPMWEFPVSQSAKAHMAGNGMHVPSVGLVILLCLVFVQPVKSD